MRDTGVPDATIDGAIDAAIDASVDAGRRDGGPDAATDAGHEAGVDAGDGGSACGVLCDDGIACTDDDCDPATGGCTSVPNSMRCPPGLVCVPRMGCRAVPCRADEVCVDGFFCNGVERCVNGQCVAGAPVACTNSQCQVNRCDEATRSCVGTWRDDDGDGFPPFACMGGDCDDRDPRVFPGARENCSDGRDNNCDFAIDCDDGTCRNQDVCNPPPPREGDCQNGIDDDRDGSIDCADSDCFFRPQCQMRIEICGDGIDNDGDNSIDCNDSDCASEPECRMSTCPAVNLGQRQGRVATGTTNGATNERSPNCIGAFHDAPEITHQWRAPRAGTWTFDTIGSNYDAALYVLAGNCNGPQIACNDDGAGEFQARVTLSLSAGQTVVVVVDGYGSARGNYVLNINPAAVGTEIGFCSDGRDNDNDGLTDCQDPDCIMDPACFVPRTERGQCNDGVDNDGDGAIDCFDSDCIGDMNCVVMPRCPDAELGSQVGAPVIADSTVGQGNDFTPTCLLNASNAPDVAYRWRAPQAGRWVFDTFGSDYDTAISVLAGSCDGPTLACNDDASQTLDSSVTLTLAAGQQVVIVIDGYARSSGSYVLNIGRIVTNERGQCADFIDNDGDGAADCFDSDCSSDPNCQQMCEPSETGVAACTDGRDNDCNGLRDCADPACRSLLGTECCNGVDDDGDGVVDLLACGCQASMECGPIQSPIGVVPTACWPRLGACGPDCSAFPVALGNAVCRFINPAWRCQRTTGQCVPAP